MKIRQIKIENLRGIALLEHNFVDVFDRVKAVTLISGPNGSGKTTLLDAISFGLMSAVGNKILRQDIRKEPQYIVAQGKPFAGIKYTIEISEEERQDIVEWKKQLVDLGAIVNYRDPDFLIAEVEWTYPAQVGFSTEYMEFGGYRYRPPTGWAILQGRNYARRLRALRASRVTRSDQAGSIYFFEQERQVVGRPIRTYEPLSDNNTQDMPAKAAPIAVDIRRLLIDLGIKQQVGTFSKEHSWYTFVQEGFNHICDPNRMGDVYATGSDAEYEIEFINGENTGYGFDGLSSGEKSVLNFLVQYAYRRMKNSIVLIDELELHLHPTWQRRLIEYLATLKDNNQFIITTHSPTLTQFIESDSRIDLGELDEIPDWQSDPLDEIVNA